MNRKPLVPMLSLALALSLAQATALEAAQPPTKIVKVSDLDLSTARGQRLLDRRVKAAVYAVCVQVNSGAPRSEYVLASIEQCKTRAFDSVQQQLARMGVEPDTRAAQR
jgi:UrcA family protein